MSGGPAVTDQLKVSRISDQDADEIDRVIDAKRKEYEAGQAKKAKVKPNNDPCPGPTGNTCGGIFPKTKPAPKSAKTNPDKQAETKEESAWDQFKQGAKDGAQYYKDQVSPGLHEFAGSAMETGGTVAAAGEGTMLAGVGVAATGVGAPVAAAMEAVGGATTAVGGGVAAVGGVSEGAATLFDTAADMIITGETPNLIGPLIQLGETLLTRLIASKVPGAAGGNDKANIATPQSANSSGGGYVRGEGRCKLKAYSKGCPSPQTPHHVVPDHCFKQPGETGAYYPGTEKVKHANGLCICVGGATKSTAKDGSFVKKVKGQLLDAYRQLAEHGKIHIFTDAGEYALGQAGDPKGTTTLGKMEELGARVAGKITGCDPAYLKEQLRDHHQENGLGPDTKVRADPWGQVKDLDPSAMGTGQTHSGDAF